MGFLDSEPWDQDLDPPTCVIDDKTYPIWVQTIKTNPPALRHDALSEDLVVY